MKKRNYVSATAFLLLVIVLGWINFSAQQATPVFAVFDLNTVLVVDAGHGGVDSGCVGNGVLEKDVTLPIALKLARLLETSGASVVCTRSQDIELCRKTSDITWRTRWRKDLEKRVSIAEDAQADLLISIHANSIGSSTWRGAQVFYQREADEGKLVAESIQAALQQSLGNTSRNAQSGDYYVLRTSSMPAVIIEVGFLSNQQEAHELQSGKYQEEVAWAIYKGIVEYLKQPSNKQNVQTTR